MKLENPWKVNMRCIGVILVLVLISPLCAEGTKRKQPPTPSESVTGESLVSRTYASELEKARTAGAKKQLALKLLQTAKEESSAVIRWALTQRGLDLAVGSGDSALGIKMIDSLSSEFEIDRMTMLADFVERISKTLPQSEATTFLDIIAKSAIEAIDSESYKSASRMLTIGIRVASRSPNHSAIGWRYEADARRAVELAKFRDAARQDKALLGKYHCFLRDDWKTGLPLLQEDKELGDLASKDCRGATEAESQVALADDWRRLGAKCSDSEQAGCLRRALLWYRRGASSSKGIARGHCDALVAKCSTDLAELEAKTGGFGAYAGNWDLTYNSGLKWSYTIRSNGEVTIHNSPDRNGRRGYFIRRQTSLVIVWDSGQVVERLELRDGRRLVERFWVRDYPSLSHSSGAAVVIE